MASAHAAGRREPGHRPGPRPRRPRASAPLEPRVAECAERRSALASGSATQAGQGPLHLPARPRPELERALRRTRLPVAYSEGFSPRPLLASGWRCPQAASPWLSTSTCASRRAETPGGIEVRDQLSDAELGWLADRIGALLPQGLDVVALAPLHGAEGSLQEEVTSCSWIVEVLGHERSRARGRVASVLGAVDASRRRIRKGRTVSDDLQPDIMTLELEGPGGEPGLAQARRRARHQASRSPAREAARRDLSPDCGSSGRAGPPMDRRRRRTAPGAPPGRTGCSWVPRRGHGGGR